VAGLHPFVSKLFGTSTSGNAQAIRDAIDHYPHTGVSIFQNERVLFVDIHHDATELILTSSFGTIRVDDIDADLLDPIF
jgi:hypothetical protein